MGLRARTEPQVWSLSHHWREARVSTQEDGCRCGRETAAAAVPRPQPGDQGWLWLSFPVTDGSQAAAGHHQTGQTVRPAQRRPERERENSPSCLDVSLPALGVNCNFSNSLLGKHFTLPTTAISAVLDNVWSDKGAESPDCSWPEKGSEGGLGLGELASRVNQSSAEMSSWETTGVQSFC